MPTRIFYSSSGNAVLAPLVEVVTPPPVPSRRTGRVLGTLTSVNNPLAQVGHGGLIITGSGGLLGNPHYPCLAGPEILPTGSAFLPMDTGTGYLFDFPLPPTSGGTTSPRAITEFQNFTAQQSHIAAYDLYVRGNELVQTDITTLTLQLVAASSTGTSVVTPAGPTVLAALSAPGGSAVVFTSLNPIPADPSYTSAASVALQFDSSVFQPGGDYANYRILRVGLRYLAWRDASALDLGPGEGFEVFWVNTALTVPGRSHGNWAVLEKQNNAQYVVKWLGEANYRSQGRRAPTAAVPEPSNSGHPFTGYDMSLMQSGVTGVFMTALPSWDSFQTIVNLDYVEMVVEVVPERRSLAGMRLVRNVGATQTFPTDMASDVALYYSLNDLQGFALSPNTRWTLVTREALPPSPSDRLRAAPPTLPLQSNTLEATGPPIQIKAVTQYRGAHTLGDGEVYHRLATYSNGRLVGVPEEFEEYASAVSIRDNNYLTAGAWWASYSGQSSPAASEISAFSNAFAGRQRVYVDGLTTFDRVDLLAWPDDLCTDNLTITVYDSANTPIATAVAFPSVVRTFPDVGSGFREFYLTLTPTITPPAGYYTIAATSPADSLAPWHLGGATSPGGVDWTGYDPNADALPLAYYTDFSMKLACTPTVPPAPTVTPTNLAVNSRATCGIAQDPVLALTWAADSLNAVDRYAVYRSDDGGTTYDIVAVLDNNGTSMAWTDLAPPWGLALKYRLSTYRFSDRTEVLGTVTNVTAITAPGAVLGISSDTEAMLYVPSDEGDLALGWEDLTKSEQVMLHGENYSRSLHPSEDRGFRFTFNAVIEDFALCTVATVNTPSVGAKSLSPAAWAQIQRFSREPYVNVQFPDGMTRQMHLQLGNMVVRTAFGVYLAEIVLTDAAVNTLVIDPEA